MIALYDIIFYHILYAIYMMCSHSLDPLIGSFAPHRHVFLLHLHL
jgi:hypothetical protein